MDNEDYFTSNFSEYFNEEFGEEEFLKTLKKLRKITADVSKMGDKEEKSINNKEEVLEKIKRIKDITDYSSILDLINENVSSRMDINLKLCDKLEYIGFDILEGNNLDSKDGMFSYIVKEFIINIKYFNSIPNLGTKIKMWRQNYA